MKKNKLTETERIIEAFQDKCLATVQQVTKAATDEIDRLAAENASLRGNIEFGESHVLGQCKLLERTNEALTHEVEKLRGQLLLAVKVRTERDARIENLLRLLNERDDALAVNDHETKDDRIAVLENELRKTTEACEHAKSDAESAEEASGEFQKKIEELEEEIEKLTADPEMVASACHDWLRSCRLLPANLDAPLKVLPHEYRMGFQSAVGSELP